MKKILIIGATSAIVEATARIWASEAHELYLVARNKERLNAVAADLQIRGAKKVHTSCLDLSDYSEHKKLIDKAINTLKGIDIVLIGHGSLSNQKNCQQDFSLTHAEFTTNALSVISLLTHLANYFETQQGGTIAVISSVAGDRGRQSNYVYGSAKGAVTLFMQGLRQRLYKSKVHVLTIKPGFVDTPMTSHIPKGILWAQPEQVAKKIHKHIVTNKNVLYVPGFWFFIMNLVRAIPEAFFKRMHL